MLTIRFGNAAAQQDADSHEVCLGLVRVAPAILVLDNVAVLGPKNTGVVNLRAPDQNTYPACRRLRQQQLFVRHLVRSVAGIGGSFGLNDGLAG